METVKVGLIGVGNIAPAYIKGCRTFRILEVKGCTDIDTQRAKAFATEHGITAYESLDALLADPEMDIVINLTIPAVHAEVSLKAIAAGKHVYSEKPLAINRADGEKVIQAAKNAGLRLGCAPDTFLGGGLQTARKVLDDGWIGTPVAATAFFAGHGPEAWHPNPAFFYQVGGGPVLDIGVYPLTALVNFFGAIKRVSASTRISQAERIATSEARFGEKLRVEVSTHAAATLEFASGPIGTLIASFDMWRHNLPRIEIYGTEGTLSVPDPNTFGGPVSVWLPREGEWREIPHSHSTDVGRGMGVADMAYALKSGRPHRASGDLAYHVLEVMESFDASSQKGQHIQIQSTVPRPAALPLNLLPRTLDE